MTNFKGTYSKLFWNPCVQIERLENGLPKYMVKTNKPKRYKEDRIKAKSANSYNFNRWSLASSGLKKSNTGHFKIIISSQ